MQHRRLEDLRGPVELIDGHVSPVWCATVMSPGPNTTGTAPSAANCGPSVPNETVSAARPDAFARKATTSESTGVS